MIVVDKNNLINGNTALVPNELPQRKRRENNEEYDKLNEAKREALRKARKKQNREKLKILRNIACFFVVGMMIVGRYTIIYSKQNEISDLKKQVRETNKEMDNLRIKLVKYNNINYVEKKAIEDLKMVKPNRGVMYECNLDKNNFKEKNEETPKKDDFITKIKKMLF